MSAQPNALADPYAAYGGQAIPAQSASDPYAAYGGKVASAGVDLSNQQRQGTYQMRNQQGQTIGVPYEQVPQAAQQGYRFAQEQDGWRYQKDHNYGTTGPGHEAEYAQSDRNAPLPMQAISGVVKGIGTIGKPVMDVVGRLGGVPQNSIDSSLQAQTPMETAGKVGMIGTAIAPAAIAAPVATASGLVGGTVGAGAGNVIANAAGMSPENTALMQDAGGLAGGIGGAKLGSMAINGPFQAVRNAAQGNPDAAALKGLNVSAKSKVALRTIQNTDAARPYLQGVQNLEDLQARIPQAKAEVWGPYQRTIDAIGGKTVEGPEGPTTIAELENQRLQLSAINRGVKSGDPATLQLVQQKGLNQADLIAQQHAVQDALDPHLEQAGIRPQLIRKTFAQISGVGNRTMGRSTISESNTPYGVGKAANLSFTRPLAAPGEVAGGLRDIVAGRPLISGKATDVNIREAFRSGGKKPNLGEFDPRSQVAPISRQLPAQVQPIQLPSSFESLMQLRNGAQ